jgi:hypothetical protein
MAKLTRLTALVALAFALVLAGCNNAADKAGTKTPAEPEGGAKSLKSVPTGKKSGTATSSKAEAPTKEKQAKADPEEEAGIAKNLAKLSPEDRKLAEEQRFCVVEEENRLGSMGAPMKLDLKGKTAFVCCGSCKKQALADPEKTLAKVEELKAKNKETKKQ